MAVVLALIGMLALMIMPRLPSSGQENLKNSARTLAATLRYAQERAAVLRTNYYISIAPGTDTFTLYEVAADGNGREPSDPLLQKSPLKDGIQIADVVIPRLGKTNDGQMRLDVGMGGLRDFVTLHLRSSAGQFWTVMAFPAGGKVRCTEGYQDEPN